ncbi:hypothetical protein [Frankia sp. Cppng1_Ct_nod]|uniref:hypothetical protein n=1 Tax=Frankia sp. Cppng1_Ct_nod TaxID=2897162 RepID=UPI001041438A|nr:hypothetical protein [Frankia sp. Cppng1_Ct_nod]
MTTMRESPESLIDASVGDGGPTADGHRAQARAREATGLESPAAPDRWTVALRHRVAGWTPVAQPPATPPALVRYATRGAWCADYAVGWRRAGVAYVLLVGLPVTAVAYGLARLVQTPAGLGPVWLPGEVGVAAGRVERWAAALPHPPPLADVTAGAVTDAPTTHRRLAGCLVVAVSAAAYAMAWTAARPGRLLAAATLLSMLWIFV